MCAIGGIVNFCSSKIPGNIIQKMSDEVIHRGPDDFGFFVWGNGFEPLKKIQKLEQIYDDSLNNFSIALIHRRLSILDLSPLGRQPMSSSNGRFRITYNGEIFNYLELRKILEEKYEFRTHTDTEVILAAYEEWGEDCLNKFNGMWSFCILDLKKKTVFASRDRFGVKPFYYYFSDRVFVFGSEIKQILPFKDFSANFETINQFVVFGDINTSEQTSFSQVKQLLPGHKLTLDLENPSSLKISAYYSLSTRQVESNDNNFQDTVEAFSELFKDSVSLRMRSDVEVGACLSGGLDSSSIVAVASELVGGKIKTFTSCFADKKYDEWEYAELVAKRFSSKAFQVFPSLESLKNDLNSLIWHQEEPFRSSSTYAQWCVMSEAKKQKIKVLLDGQGADEALSGYHWYIPLLFSDLIKAKDYKNFFRILGKMRSTGILSATEGTLKVLLKSIYYQYFNHRREYRYKSKYFSDKLEIKRSIGFKNTIIDSQVQDLSCNLSSLLRYEDRNSMAFSIESRTPFLDYRVVEFLINQPILTRFKGGWTKSLLRTSMKSILPPNVVWRVDKKGFVTPQDQFLSSLYSMNFEDVFKHPDLSKWYDIDELKKDFYNRALPENIFWSAFCIDKWLITFSL